MKFAAAENGMVVVKETDMPRLAEGDILVRMRACGVCGSDLEKVYGSYGMASKRIGHEISGEVAQSKNNAFSLGDRVFVHHHVPCHECYYCKGGDYTLCAEYYKSNVEPCGLAEFIRVPAWNVDKGGVIRIPQTMDFESAALAEPLACCIKAANKLGPVENAAVIGAGPAGLMNAMLLQAGGANVFLVDSNDYRLDFAQKYGLMGVHVNDGPAAILKDATDGRGVDAVIVAAGNEKAIASSLNLVRKGGKILIFGVPPKGTALGWDANAIFANEIQVLTSGYCSEIETTAALELIGNGFDVASLITHRFALAEANAAFETAHRGEGMKVVVTG